MTSRARIAVVVGAACMLAAPLARAPNTSFCHSLLDPNAPICRSGNLLLDTNGFPDLADKDSDGVKDFFQPAAGGRAGGSSVDGLYRFGSGSATVPGLLYQGATAATLYSDGGTWPHIPNLLEFSS